MQRPAFNRVLLKLSGEALAGERAYGIDPKIVQALAAEIAETAAAGCEIALVIGAGNIFRGLAASEQGMDRASADYMGMLATVMNSLAMQDALVKAGAPCRVLSAIAMREVAEPYIRNRAISHLEKKRVVICAAGTGNPYFTTDTAAALRAMELGCQAIFKATKVNGIYDKDPVKHPGAVMFDTLTYLDVLQKKIKVMDSTAVTLAMDNRLPIAVFNLFAAGNIRRVASGEAIGTLVTGD